MLILILRALTVVFLLINGAAKMGSQVLVPFRGAEDSHRHLKLMGDLGQVNILRIYLFT